MQKEAERLRKEEEEGDRLQREADRLRKEEEEASLRLAEQRRREEEVRLQIETERQRRKEEEARLQKEAERCKKEEEARLQLERQLQEEQEQRRVEAERRKTEEEARLHLERQHQEEQEHRRVEAERLRQKLEEARSQLEVERHRREEEEERHRLEAERRSRKVLEEEEVAAKLKKEAEQRQRKREQEKKRIDAERRQKKQEEEACRMMEVEKKRREEEEQHVRRLEALRKQRKKEEEMRLRLKAERLMLEEEQERQRAESKRRKLKEEEARLLIEAEQRRRECEAERLRLMVAGQDANNKDNHCTSEGQHILDEKNSCPETAETKLLPSWSRESHTSSASGESIRPVQTPARANGNLGAADITCSKYSDDIVRAVLGAAHAAHGAVLDGADAAPSKAGITMFTGDFTGPSAAATSPSDSKKLHALTSTPGRRLTGTPKNVNREDKALLTRIRHRMQSVTKEKEVVPDGTKPSNRMLSISSSEPLPADIGALARSESDTAAQIQTAQDDSDQHMADPPLADASIGAEIVLGQSTSSPSVLPCGSGTKADSPLGEAELELPHVDLAVPEEQADSGLDAPQHDPETKVAIDSAAPAASATSEAGTTEKTRGKKRKSLMLSKMLMVIDSHRPVTAR